MFVFTEVTEPLALAEVSVEKLTMEHQPEDPIAGDERKGTPPIEEALREPDSVVCETPPVIQQDEAVKIVQSKVDKRSQEVSTSSRTPSRNVKSPTGGLPKNIAPKSSSGGAVGRSQIPKPSAARSSESSPIKSVADVARTSPTKSATGAAIPKGSSRSTMAVVGRAKTVELGKNLGGKKMSVGEHQAPKVVRQMSTGQMQPQLPSKPLTTKARTKSVENPMKRVPVGSMKTEESKKAVTTTGTKIKNSLREF